MNVSNSPKRPKRDEVTKWHDSTNVVLDFYQSYLEYGSITDSVQLSSLRDMNNALLVNTHQTYDDRLAEAETVHYRAVYLGAKLQILFHREHGTEYHAWSQQYTVLHEQGRGARTAAADEAALTDPHLATIDPFTFVVSRPSSFQ